MLRLIKNQLNKIPLFMLLGLSAIHLFITGRMNVFRYNNFDFGKFDLGNMAQMEWNTLHGRVLWLTDYFGTNLPRWSMSHVDPILLLFTPIFAIFPHPLTLVFSQLFLVVSGATILYLIADLYLNSKTSAAFIGAAYLFYPALGFINAQTGFHGVSAVIPFFLLAFYIFEKMYRENKFTRTRLVLFWLFIVLTLAGKEQLSLYVFMFGIYLLVSKYFFVEHGSLTVKKLGISLVVIGLAWFIICFGLIIPHYADYRIAGYQRFAVSLGLEDSTTRDVELPNYFLSRYDAFGEGYLEIFVNMLLDPRKTVLVFWGGDKMENFTKTLQPTLFLPFAAPQVFMIAGADFAINYLTSAGGIGTAEIYNHRISMIIPVLFVALIAGIATMASYISKKTKAKISFKMVALIFSLGVLSSNIYTTFQYENPVYLWFTQALKKRLALTPVFAKTDEKTAKSIDLKIGDILRLSSLDNKDVECSNKIVNMIPEDASVSGPDYLGAHLGMRETYAIFPALYKEADYVIVDVFSRKILTILNVNLDLVGRVVEDLIKDPKYEMSAGCGNLFVFKKVGVHAKSTLMPIQERYEYPARIDLPIFQGLTMADYELPKTIQRGKTGTIKLVYTKTSNESLNDYILFMTFVNVKTGDIYQTANLPSFSIRRLSTWNQGRYYEEYVDINAPQTLSSGLYRTFVGMTNNVRTRSIYLGDLTLE